MSEFVEIEWFGREDKIGIALTYDEFNGFKCRMAPLPHFVDTDEMLGVRWLMENAAKIPFEWAWGIFKERMMGEWTRRHLPDVDATKVRYDHRDYSVTTLKELQ